MKIKKSESKEVNPLKIDFDAYSKANENRGRHVNVPVLNQLQDSLITRGYKEPQRLAILATAASEMDDKGAASQGIGGNGILGYNSTRMPISYLDDSIEGRGNQIHFLLNDIETIHPDNWSNGGKGGPYILNAKDAYDQFWSSEDPEQATIIFNKGNIRPAGGEKEWNARGKQANVMKQYHYQKGGSLVYTSFIPELINKRNKETINKPLIIEDNSRYPVQSVSVYKPKPIETSASDDTTPVPDPVSDQIVDTIERLSVNGANNDNLNAINKELKNAGYKKTQRAAILATIVAESGANPTAIGDAGKAKGLFQWHPNRFNAGIDLDSQIQWLLTEIKDRNNVNAWTSSRKYNKDSAYDLFHNTEDLNEAISTLTSNYIRPANTDREIAKRYNIAQQLISQMV